MLDNAYEEYQKQERDLRNRMTNLKNYRDKEGFLSTSKDVGKTIYDLTKIATKETITSVGPAGAVLGIAIDVTATQLIAYDMNKTNKAIDRTYEELINLERQKGELGCQLNPEAKQSINIDTQASGFFEKKHDWFDSSWENHKNNKERTPNIDSKESPKESKIRPLT